ncbi:hypothetical protein LJR225_004659 [Phenylobacterium sp. LjRoot225]|uniref:hypothetical protein n=1 Tax=Phenylobacterium sp. LjRoot225 TaxID=3342285 RepID=UPI003ECF4D4E
MQTFRAYIQDAAGAITWAAWVEAAHRDDAQAQAQALRPGQSLSLDLWSAAERRLYAASELEAV